MVLVAFPFGSAFFAHFGSTYSCLSDFRNLFIVLIVRGDVNEDMGSLDGV